MKMYNKTFSIKRLWIILIAGMVVMFGILLFLGSEIYQMAPPIPKGVESASGEVLYTRDDIETGQNVWQSIGGMEQGSIWGHGSYLAPDWSADWLHREAAALLAIKRAHPLRGLTPAEMKAVAKASLIKEMRRNTYDPKTDTITLSDDRARAIEQVESHYLDLYQGSTSEALALRRDYALPVHGTISEKEAQQLSAFYFWTAWGATTERPGKNLTYNQQLAA